MSVETQEPNRFNTGEEAFEPRISDTATAESLAGRITALLTCANSTVSNEASRRLTHEARELATEWQVRFAADSIPTLEELIKQNYIGE